VAVPTDLIAGVRAAHVRLHATLAGLDDATVRRPSRLPGWSVAHVLTHLARNADSVVRRVQGAAAGTLVPQYPGDRDAEIDAGAGRPAGELTADLVRADDAVDALFGRVPAAVWEQPVLRTGGGGPVPATRLAYSRWREVEVHHVDLGLGYGPEDWPAGLVELMLPDLLTGLPGRTSPALLAAWALDRAAAPTLTSWDS
jgi:maleylpyruvate isomerase